MYCITGCSGFIGYHLTIKLLKNKFEVIGIDNLNSYYDYRLKLDRLKKLKKYKNFVFYKADLRYYNKTKLIFGKNKIGTIFHLASQPIKLNKVIEIIKKIPKLKFNYINKKKRKGEMLQTFGSNKKILNEIKDFKFNDFKYGFKKTYNRFKKYKKKSLMLRTK